MKQSTPIRLNASANRWEWLFSTDKVGFFFDKNTIRYGTKEQFNSKTYKYYKIVDRSKIIVFIKFIYSDVGIEDTVNTARNSGYYEFAEMVKNGRYFISKYEFDYANQRFRYVSGTWYDDNGNALTSHSNDFKPWEDIYPNTNVERFAIMIQSYAIHNDDIVAQQTNTLD